MLLLRALLFVSALLASSRAAAQPPEDAPSQPPRAEAEIDAAQLDHESEQRALEASEGATHDPLAGTLDDRRHREQIGIRLGVALGYRIALPYGGGPACNRGADRLCTQATVGLFDVEVSFAPTSSIEALLALRLGMADDGAVLAGLPVELGLGVRGYLEDASLAKLFVDGALVVDLTSSAIRDWTPVDLGVRGHFGVQLDVIRWLGLYAQVGVNVMVVRSFEVIFEGGLGAQARFP